MFFLFVRQQNVLKDYINDHGTTWIVYHYVCVSMYILMYVCMYVCILYMCSVCMYVSLLRARLFSTRVYNFPGIVWYKNKTPLCYYMCLSSLPMKILYIHCSWIRTQRKFADTVECSYNKFIVWMKMYEVLF